MREKLQILLRTFAGYLFYLKFNLNVSLQMETMLPRTYAHISRVGETETACWGILRP